MPAGLPYFAWIDPGEDVFGPGHMRWDENIFSFTLKQDEGDPASLTAVVRRPRNVDGDPIGLLGPGRKIWCWFALDCGPDLIRFRGRLVGVPTSLFEELVTLEFVARPIDLVAQKADLADTLRVLPYYDEVVIDEARRTDPEVVLEGYSAIWHYDRETHVLSISDEIDGEDGLVEFDGASDGGKVLYDGLGLTLTSGPLSRVDVTAEYTWTQQARGTTDLTPIILAGWPNGVITSYSFTADNWPKAGAGIGDGWVVTDSSATALYDLTVHTKTDGSTLKVDFGDSSFNTTFTETKSFLTPGPPAGSINLGTVLLKDDIKVTYGGGGEEAIRATSYSRSYSDVSSFLPLNYTRATLSAAYTANRQCTEQVLFSLYADVQSILTDPEDGEALSITDIKSVNLSEAIGEGADAYVPIGNTARRSYIATERGNRSLEHLIAVARANIFKRARVVEIAFAPKLERMPEITLRKNGFLVEPRVGEALGKIIGYSLALDGNDGQIKCEIRIGCTIGRGGSAVASGGEPTYCDVDYCGADYQVFTGRIVLFDSSVGYAPPASDPNDDGLELTGGGLTAGPHLLATPVGIENPPDVQLAHIHSVLLPSSASPLATDDARQAVVAARAEAINNALAEVETKITFKLKSMTGDFTTEYVVQVTDLKVPAGYDLEAA
jgi:hypothetical protein